MKKPQESRREQVISALLGLALMAGILSLLALVCGQIMEWFGFEARSKASLIGFFVLTALVSYPLGLVAGALPKALLKLELLPKLSARILYVLLDSAATFYSLRAVDSWMLSVSASNAALLVVSILLALCSVGDVGPKAQNP